MQLLSDVLASDGTTAGGGTLNATTNPLSATAGIATFGGKELYVSGKI